ncbi:MAG: MBL fold metallo-hydrolase [Alteromonadaceae bacterium]|nr:MBL fold metallo-hydrolase [Alteromonadaceae bacterium]
MKQVQPDVWETEAESPFPGLTTHAYLVELPDANVLFYNTGHAHEINEMFKYGGVDYHLLSHRDEVGPSLRDIRQLYGAKLGGHINEGREFAEIQRPDIYFDERGTLIEHIEAIPTPGHSPGSTCFMVQSSTDKRYLFTGDTLYRNGDGNWRAGVIPGETSKSEQKELAKSLQLLRSLEPDVVFCSAFSGEQGYQEVTKDKWVRIVDHALTELS